MSFLSHSRVILESSDFSNYRAEDSFPFVTAVLNSANVAGSSQQMRILRFESFEFDPQAAELHHQGVKIRIHGQPLEILTMLLDRRGEIVRREEFRARLWPVGTFVDFEHSLNAAVNKLRETLGDSAEEPRFIETIPRRGYRFIAPVETPTNGTQAPLDAPPTREAIRNWMVAGFVVALLAATVALIWSVRRPHAVPNLGPGRALLAILPFQNLSGDSQQDYFTDSFTDEMITELGALDPRRLGVIARTSVMKYKRSQKDARQIGRELEVDYLLEGSVLRLGQRVRITAQLIRASDQTHLWARRYERDLSDVFAVQDDVARAVADQVEIKLGGAASARLSATRAVDPEAYDAYLKALLLCRTGSPDDVHRAAQLLEQATATDPRFARAYAMLALAYAGLVSAPYTPSEAMSKARAAALKAMELDDQLAESHVALAFVKLYFDWDWASAEKEYNRAAELNPAAHSLLVTGTWYLASKGRIGEGLEEMHRAERLDPIDSEWPCREGRLLYYAHQYKNAIRIFEKTAEMDPSFVDNCVWVGFTYEQVGRYADAIAVLHKSIHTSPRDLDAVGALGRAYALAGERAEAVRQLNKLLALAQTRYVSPSNLVLIHAGLGHKEQVFRLLEQAFRDRDGNLVFLNIDPVYDPYRSDPHFKDLVRRIGLPP